MEWHANFISSCLLMPKKTFRIAADNIFKQAGIDDSYIILGQDFETDEFAMICHEKFLKYLMFQFKQL